MDPVFASWLERDLVWLPEKGMGYLPVSDSPYDEEYFARYEDMAATALGRQITAARVALVDRFIGGDFVIDVGIGCGAFVAARRERDQATSGYDINPTAVEWLTKHYAFLDPRDTRVNAATFWDSIEHIPDPTSILRNVQGWVFACLPIFRDPGHVLASKHLRRDEHCWYWTRDGFVGWMYEHGFECVEHGTPETLMGREDIGTFVFRRVA